jgi:hypothetical protein
MLALAVQSLMAFNLVCSGTSVVLTAKHSRLPEFRIDGDRGLRPMRAVYAIDLASGRYCVDKCTETSPLAAVTYGEIVLEDKGDRFGAGTTYRSVNRESGAYSAYFDTKSRRKLKRVMIVGTCKAGPFSGFPKRVF